jgi:hypothetical protein
LKDQRGRYLIYDRSMLLALVASLVQKAVRLAAGEPFVPEMNRQGRQFSKFVGKSLGSLCLRTLLSGKMQRVSNHDGGYAEAPRQAGQRTQVFARIAPPLQGENRLRGQAEFVGDGYADTLRADVEAEKTGWWRSVQRTSPRNQLNGLNSGRGQN